MQVGANDNISEPSAARAEEQAPVNPPGECRALVVLEGGPARKRPAPHRQSAFLAHLIATREQHPQTRARRRAEPDEVVRAYKATARLMAG